MKPGDMVKNRCFLDFYPTAKSVNYGIPDDDVPTGCVGMILSPPDGTWVKWMVNGKVGWSDWNYLEVLQ